MRTLTRDKASFAQVAISLAFTQLQRTFRALDTSCCLDFEYDAFDTRGRHYACHCRTAGR